MHIGAVILHLILPDEISFYLDHRYPKLLTLLGLVLIPFAGLWAILPATLPMQIQEFIRLAREAPHINVWEEVFTYAALMLGPIILIIILRLLLKRCLKPTAEMLRYNERVSAELASAPAPKVVARKTEAAEPAGWICPACGADNTSVRKHCWRCDGERPAAAGSASLEG